MLPGLGPQPDHPGGYRERAPAQPGHQRQEPQLGLPPGGREAAGHRDQRRRATPARGDPGTPDGVDPHLQLTAPVETQRPGAGEGPPVTRAPDDRSGPEGAPVECRPQRGRPGDRLGQYQCPGPGREGREPCLPVERPPPGPGPGGDGLVGHDGGRLRRRGEPVVEAGLHDGQSERPSDERGPPREGLVGGWLGTAGAGGATQGGQVHPQLPARHRASERQRQRGDQAVPHRGPDVVGDRRRGGGSDRPGQVTWPHLDPVGPTGGHVPVLPSSAGSAAPATGRRARSAAAVRRAAATSTSPSTGSTSSSPLRE